ncbi:MAG: efflux RND transporter periplasmic adaptor subunit [Arenicellales bacterium]|jgi:HlyD family secretion protein
MNKQQDVQVETARSLEEILAQGGKPRRFARLRPWIVVALVLAAAVLAYRFIWGTGESGQLRYHTEAAVVGNLVVNVSATGNLQPTNQVDVGSELSGIVEQVFVDDNDHVKKGEVLAQLDVSKLQDAVAKSRANLDAAKAKVEQTEATLAEDQANLARLEDVAKLSGGKVPSKNDMAAAQANAKRAQADVASANASVAQARADLQSDQTNLGKATIRSPIDGVVLTRQVEPGQTVAASFQAPVLFTLAEDLTKMELQVDVDEADVGKVQVGQDATFTVDAWPGREYKAVITQVGYGSQTTAGVVSYPAKLQVDNDDLSLRPGMTATADITTLTRKNVLLVSNAALRFTPPVQSAEQASSGGGLLRALIPHRPHRERRQEPEPAIGEGNHRVWVLENDKPVAVQVKTGPTDGRMTEITAGGIKAGTKVITEALTGKQ